MDNQHTLVERVAETMHTVALIGALDSGKTTLSKTIIERAVSLGRTAALIDADLGQKAVGPPTAVGLKVVRDPEDIGALERADSLYFVGAISPEEHLLSVVAGTARLVGKARELGAELVVVDTSGLVSGWAGQTLKFHKLELIQPDMVIGLHRGEELAPLLGIAQRFFSGEVASLPVHPAVVPTSVEQRAVNRQVAMGRYFSDPLQRWRVKPTVFMPVLPPLFDLRQLERVVVGLSDGEGAYLGLGYLEQAEEGILRLVSPVADAPKALRLGSVRLDESFDARRVDLRNLLGTD